LKIVLVGAAAVGKTSLIHRYINDDFGNTTAVRLAFSIQFNSTIFEL